MAIFVKPEIFVFSELQYLRNFPLWSYDNKGFSLTSRENRGILRSKPYPHDEYTTHMEKRTTSRVHYIGQQNGIPCIFAIMAWQDAGSDYVLTAKIVKGTKEPPSCFCQRRAIERLGVYGRRFCCGRSIKAGIICKI